MKIETEQQAGRARELEIRVREICRSQGLPEPDELIEGDEADEVLALWHEREVALVIELSE